jgi:hypothetical protein
MRIPILLGMVAVPAACIFGGCGGEFSSLEALDAGEGGMGDVSMGDVATGVGDATPVEGGGVCCPVVSDPCSACGRVALGGWAASAAGCMPGPGPCDGLIGILPDSHGCPAIVTGQGNPLSCCGCAPGPDGGVVDGGIAEAAPIPDASTGRAVDCAADAGVTVFGPGDPGIADTVHGTNGTFVDACDSTGNLVDYICETATVCGPGPNPGCRSYTTGLVVPKNINCSGHCANARCDGRCPAQGQSFHYVAVNNTTGAATIHNDSDGRTYVCTLIFDSTQDSFDCTKGPAVGGLGTIVSLGLQGSYCTGVSFGNIGVNESGQPAGMENCAYACSIP